MNVETLIPTATSVGGGFFAGIMLGYFVKKIIKVLMFVVGGIAGLLLYLHQQQIISVSIDKLETSLMLIVTTLGSSFDSITQIGDATFLGIPLVDSVSAGFTIGLIKG
jgi:uncharacterized membrane protein (Fun14 family)